MIPDGDSAADLFDATQAMTRAAGLPRYEVSNHARIGQESRHNLAYWRYADYAGVGPGAHGRRLGQATERHKKPENFISAVDRNGHGLKVETDLPDHERATEAMLMGLRLTEGIDLSRIEARSGLARDAFVDADAVARLERQGLMRHDGDRLIVTDDGILLLDSILSEVVRTG
jgi:oxygen-independent coproporphyrinogen-3 oxidase